MTSFETPRLILREFREDDVAPLARILADPRVMEFSIVGPMDVAATRAFLNACLDSCRDHGFGQWAVVERAAGRLAGFCGISPVRVGGRDEVELGLPPGNRPLGRGLATEAGAVVLASAFGHWRLDSVVAIIAERHQASRPVAEKLGLAFDYATRYHGWDVAVYRCTRAHTPPAAPKNRGDSDSLP